ncbi:MAG: ABC transporter transmembrane domain-containing protein [Gammaproteobacteria bacterium]|nr:ABC transporter transmembrane domain-containing protein [Gammaproteobacteria bacterium]MDD9896375.1 ABC transporter transmembrane domain-containing protein [Gammaproteobacteria bacterium]MDD9960447.1 ABC transporter transmembrane domain-containing protein [Gammaproteobacteria bacterium]
MASQSSSKLLIRASRFLKPYKKQIVWASIALIFTAGLNLTLVQYVRIIVDEGFVASSMASLGQAITGFIIIAVLQAIGTFARFYWVSWLGERVTADLRQAVYSHIIALHPGYFEANLSGEIQSRITTDTTLIQSVIGSSASVALRNLLLLIGGTVFLFITNPRLTTVVLVCIPLVVGPIMFFGRRVRRLSRSTQDKVANVGAYVGESIQQIKTVQAYNHQDYDRKEFATHVENAFDIALKRIKTNAILITAVMTLVFAAIAVMIWVGGQDVINGAMSAGELTAFIVYAVMVAMAVAAIAGVLAELQRAAGALERLMDLLHAKSEITAPENPRQFAYKPRGSLRIEDLTFAYPTRTAMPALNNLSVAIEPGENIALVGPSGAGKSTLFDLILRFYDPDAGAIRLEGIDIRELDPLELRSHIAIVAQQPAMFTGNVADNIRYGNPQAEHGAVVAAAEAAYASNFIEELPDKYESFLGESGIRLSGGQKQRIAIARAILKDPEILLLDEATSALDAESERQVQLALEKLMENRTSLIIAHRLATVKNVDRILVMDAGAVIAQGSHRELMASCELYANLAELQFSDVEAAPAGNGSATAAVVNS